MKRANGWRYFYQWELNQQIIVECDCTQVHYDNGTRSEAVCCEVKEIEGQRVADVPNDLLQTAADLHVYAWDSAKGCVTAHQVFSVEARAKPADYLYTPTEVASVSVMVAALKAELVQSIEKEAKDRRRDCEDVLKLAQEHSDINKKTTLDEVYAIERNLQMDNGALMARVENIETAIVTEIEGVPGVHNSHYRGKCLGNAVTDEQWAAIGAGTFDDLYIGDYWEISDIRYRIAAFDYYSGDAVNDHNSAEQRHHITIVPDLMDTTLYEMIIAGGVSNGYVNSDISKTYLGPYLDQVVMDFGKGHIMCNHPFLTTAVSAEGVSSQVFCWRYIDLMNEHQVFGSRINGMTIFGELNRVATTDKSQLPLFMFRPDLIVARNIHEKTALYPQGKRYQYWLRDVASPRGFCTVTANGVAGANRTEQSAGIIRPVFSIVASNVKTVAARSGNAYYEDYGVGV